MGTQAWHTASAAGLARGLQLVLHLRHDDWPAVGREKGADELDVLVHPIVRHVLVGLRRRPCLQPPRANEGGRGRKQSPVSINRKGAARRNVAKEEKGRKPQATGGPGHRARRQGRKALHAAAQGRKALRTAARGFCVGRQQGHVAGGKRGSWPSCRGSA